MLNDHGVDRDDRLFQSTHIKPERVAEGFVVAGQNLHRILEHCARIREAAKSGNDRDSGGWTHARPSWYLLRTGDNFTSLTGIVSGATAKNKMLRISLRSPIASRVSDGAGWPAPCWGAADRATETLQRFP